MNQTTQKMLQTAHRNLNIAKLQRHFYSGQANSLDERMPKSLDELKRLAYTSFDGDNMRYMHWMCHVAHAFGYVPINPEAALGAYISIHAHNGMKGELIRDCIALELCCDEFWIFDTPNNATLNHMPEGVLAELMLWRHGRTGQPVRHFPWLEPGGAVKHRKSMTNGARGVSLRSAQLNCAQCDEAVQRVSPVSVGELCERIVRPVEREHDLHEGVNVPFSCSVQHSRVHRVSLLGITWAAHVVIKHGQRALNHARTLALVHRVQVQQNPCSPLTTYTLIIGV